MKTGLGLGGPFASTSAMIGHTPHEAVAGGSRARDLGGSPTRRKIAMAEIKMKAG